MADSDELDCELFESASSAVMLAAFHSIEKSDVRAEFMLALPEWKNNNRKLFEVEGRELAEELAQLKILWCEIIGSGLSVLDLVVVALNRSALLIEDDFDWVITEASTAVPHERDQWIELAFRLFRPLERPEQIAQLRSFADADQALAKRMLRQTSSVLFEENGEPNWLKRQYYYRQKQELEQGSRKPFRQLIDELLFGYEKTQKDNFIWGLISRLTNLVKDPDDEGFRSSKDVGWNHINDEQRTRIRTLAPGFLASVTIDLNEVYAEKQRYWSYVAGVAFLIDLHEAGSSWPEAQSLEFWEEWTPVVVQYQNHLYHFGDIAWQRLLNLAFERAKPKFVEAIRRWLVERGDVSLPLGRFELLPVGSDPELESVFLGIALESKRRKKMDFELFNFLLRHGSDRTEETLSSWLHSNGSELNEDGPFAEALLLCGRSAVYAEPAFERIIRDSKWGREVFEHLASGGGFRSNWLEMLDEYNLLRLWEWLDCEFPDDPHEKDGDGTVTPAHSIAIFQNQLISYIQKRGTVEAVEAFRGLLLRHPDYTWLGQVIAQTREIVRRESWKPPTSAAAIAYLAKTGMPPLCNDADLADAVKTSLARYQAELRKPNPPTELWNETAGPVKIWTPKDENNVSDCLARHVARDLKHYQVAVVRESELRQGTPAAPGDEPDIRISAPNASGTGEMLTVVIEVKCSWNRETITGMEEQLLDRYLRGLQCGIYVVAHFNCMSWSDTDARKTQMLSGASMSELIEQLEGENERLLGTTCKRLDLVILDTSV